MNLKNNLKLLLKEKDLTISQMGRLTGIPKTTLVDWLNGGNPRDLKKLKLLATKFNTTIDELCFGPIHNKNILKNLENDILAGNFDVILRKPELREK